MANSEALTLVLKTAMQAVAIPLKLVLTLVQDMALPFQIVGEAIGKLAAAAVAAANGDFKAAREIMYDPAGAEKLKERVASINALWQETGTSASAAAKAQDSAMGAAPQYAAKAGPKAAAGKKAKDNFNYGGGLNFNELDTMAAEEAASAAAYIARDKEKVQASLQTIQQSLMSKQQIEQQDYQQKQQQIQQAVQYELISETQKNQLLLQSEARHKEAIKALDEAELQQKRANAAAAVGFAGNALSTIGARSSGAAKAGLALSKMVALNQIRMETPKAAMSAAAAMAGIPIVGPGLAIAAKVAMYAMGAAQAAAVMAGGSTSSSGGGSFSASSAATPAAASVEPAMSQQGRQGEQKVTYVGIPENALMTGRAIVDAIRSVVGDGYTGDVRFVSTP